LEEITPINILPNSHAIKNSNKKKIQTTAIITEPKRDRISSGALQILVSYTRLECSDSLALTCIIFTH
jgi:hypothetical protein